MEVTNCFAVPHAERGDEVAIGKDFNRQMLALHLRANRHETVVGWYATAFPNDENKSNDTHSSDNNVDTTFQCIADTSSLIHEFYATECDENVVDTPIHLVVDTSLINDSIALRAYKSTAITLKGEPLANMFHELKLVLKSTESERIVVDRMIRSSQQASTKEKNTSTSAHHDLMGNDVYKVQLSMEKLLEMLEKVSSYVNQVVDGKIPPDDALGRRIADTLSTVPRVRPEVFDKMFNDSLQDLLMVTHLSNITRAQLAIADKLNDALDKNLGK